MQESETKVQTAASEKTSASDKAVVATEQEKVTSSSTVKTSTKAQAPRQSTPRPRAPKNQEPKAAQESVVMHQEQQAESVVSAKPAEPKPTTQKQHGQQTSRNNHHVKVAQDQGSEHAVLPAEEKRQYSARGQHSQAEHHDRSRSQDDRQSYAEQRAYESRSHEQQPKDGYSQQEGRSHDGNRNYYHNQSHQGQQRHSYKSEERQERQEHRQQQQEPRRLNLTEMSLTDLNLYARRFGIVGASLMSKDDLIKKLVTSKLILK